MTPSLTAATPGTRLERSRAARRSRIIEAVITLAREGGYDAVQLRLISELSGVGTRTIYNYFGSRDELLSAAVNEWLDREILGPAPTWPVGETTAERLLTIGRHVWEVWERYPKMLETFVRTAIAGGPRDDGLSEKGIRAFLPLMDDAFDPVDPDYQRDVWIILNTLTHSLMMSTVVGWLRVGEAYQVLERTIHRLAEHPAMDELRPVDWDYRPQGFPSSGAG